MENTETILLITTAGMITITMSILYKYYILRKKSIAILNIENEELLI